MCPQDRRMRPLPSSPPAIWEALYRINGVLENPKAKVLQTV
jgi:hypothetical protein